MTTTRFTGTSPVQVPANADLGNLAFQDSNTVDFTGGNGALSKLVLNPIYKEIEASAVEVLVYDTTRDSDGGAWRYRTQHTSWYNEPLNTATRGSRKEFPSVAVIVATSSNLTIYDGDDPALSMWMVFNGTGAWNGGLVYNAGTTQVAARNGVLALGDDQGAFGLLVINLISEVSRAYPSATDFGGTSRTPLAYRNVSSGEYSANTWRVNLSGKDTPSLGNMAIRKIAMTVFQEHLNDPETGLPWPVIAAATDGGIQILMCPDGTTTPMHRRVTFDNYGGCFALAFVGRRLFVASDGSPSNSGRFSRVINFPTNASINAGAGYRGDNSTDIESYIADIATYGAPMNICHGYNNGYIIDISASEQDDNRRDISSNWGLNRIIANPINASTGMQALINHEYNTGYIVGSPHQGGGAWLSSVETGVLQGSGELVTNGTFDSNTTGWTAQNSTLSVVSNTMNILRTGGGGSTAYQQITGLVPGKWYNVCATVNSIGSRGDLFIGTSTDGGGVLTLYGTNGSSVILSGQFLAKQTSYYLVFSVDSNNTNIRVDNVSVRMCEPERTVQGKGLQIFGSQIRKEKVNPGADLVAYRGFGQNDYFKNSGFGTGTSDSAVIGTGDFHLCGWIRPHAFSGSYAHVVSLSNESDYGQGSNNGFVLKMTSDSGTQPQGYIPYFYNANGDKASYDSAKYFRLNEWSFFVAGRRSGYWCIFVYANSGNWSTIGTYEATNLNAQTLRVGNGGIGIEEYGGDYSLALLRMTRTFPSQEQMNKMYSDERALFAPNAKATVFGSTSTSTAGGNELQTYALGYDPDTKLLHVGTYDGRSVFDGLRRVDYTTTITGASISAVNNLVADE